jgi:ACR3 family arsenite efflux pump ArsB
MMLLHSCIIGLILYILMVFVFKQNEMVAENRSILITAVILIYMILFGHGIPDKLNKNL